MHVRLQARSRFPRSLISLFALVTLAACSTGADDAPALGAHSQEAAATKLAFAVQPSNTVRNQAIAPAIVVHALDGTDAIDTTFTGNVTLALDVDPGSATLGGVLTVAAVEGVATFPGISLDVAATGYTLAATSSGLVAATSTPFDVAAFGAATQLVITTQPSNVVAGQSIAPAITVEIRDAAGNLVSDSIAQVTAAISNNPGGSTLIGTTTVNAAGGVATFGDLSLDRSQTGYTLQFAAAGLAGAISAAFNVAPAAPAMVRFTIAPGNTAATATLSPSPVVNAVDAFGNLTPSFSGQVTVAIGNNPGGSTLSGTTAILAVGGVATFGDLSLNKVGVGYTLTASAAGLTGDTTPAFDITPGAATHLVFTVQPSDTTSQDPIAPAVVVEARDAGANLATGFSGSVTIGLGSNPGGILTGTTSVNAVGGVATFTDLEIGFAANGYTLLASATGLTGDESAAFDIEPGSATQLEFLVEPTSAAAGVPIAPSVRVRALDAFGNPATSFTGSITVAKASGPAPGTLGGTLTRSAVSGVATFNDLTLDRVGAYTLSASASGLTGDTSASFNITAAAAATLVFTVQPSAAVAGVAIAPAVEVTAFDGLGNVASGFTGTITVAKASGPASGVLSGTLAAAATAGVATFGNLSLQIAGSYTLSASATGLTPATSASFTIGAAAATTLAFTVQPQDAVAGAAIAPAVQVTARDTFGNTATSFTGQVTITKASGPASGVLSGTTAVNAVAGVATFSNLVLNKAGSYSLGAAATGLTSATSTTFNIGNATADHILFTVQPSNAAAGIAIAPAIVVTAYDPFDNVANNFTSPVTLAIVTNPGGATLGGTLTIAANSGTATFSNITLDKVGTGYTLSAVASGVASATSSAFNITPGAPTHLAFTVQPSNTTAGQSITPAIQVSARDAFENLATQYTGSVAIALGNDPGNASLTATSPVTAVAGVATFSDVSLNKTGVGYTLLASASGLTGAESAGFNITAAAPSALAFQVQPSTTVAGVVINPSVRVRALDLFGNLANSFSGQITLTIGNNPGGGTLLGTTTVTASVGQATFNDLVIQKTGVGYTLVANGTGLSQATSASFDITPAAPTHLVFSVQPSTVVAGVAIAPAPTVQARDAFENLATQYTGTITVALGANPGGSTLTGTTSGAAVAGSRSFANLSLNKAASGYTLTANATGLTGVTSSTFTVNPAAASRVVFANNPTNTVAGVAINPAVTLIALDPFDNVATGFGASVTMTIGNNPGTSTLGGFTTVNAVQGNVTFNNLTLNKVGTGYTLVASSTGITGATSTAFNITPAPAAKLIFTVQPTTALAGTTLTPAVTLVARDAFDNFATGFNGAVSMAIGNNPGGSNLLGTTSVNAAAGNITFSNLALNRVGTGYTIVATSPGLTPATSAAFDIVPGDASRLFFSVQPSSAVAGQALSPAVQVTVRDGFGNLATSYNGNVSVAISANPGGATLSGTLTVAASSGLAQFPDLSLDKTGSGYTLIATGTGLVSTTSAVFNISSAPAVALTFSVQPSAVQAGSTFVPTVQVTARDTFGNQATDFTADVTLALGANPGGATLAGTLVQPGAAGVASFAGISLDRVGAGYTLTAAAAGLPTVTSATFDVSPGAPAQLVFTVQPTSTASGQAITPAIVVEARDGSGNLATQFTSAVAVAIGTNPGGGTLSGIASQNAVGGVATFAGLSIDLAGAGYTLVATGGGMTPGTSAAFEITAASASRLVFAVQPTAAVAGEDVTPAVRIEARDASGNLDTTFTGTVAVALGANPGSATLLGTASLMAMGGVAVFADLSLDKVGTGYTLVASTAGLVSATSEPFAITPAAADHLTFTVEPIDSVAGAALTPAVRIEVRDAFENRATAFTGDVTIAIGNNPGTSTLGGTATLAAAAGLATFGDLTLDKVGVDYTLTASATGLAGATSAAFDISHAAANRLAFSVQPSNVPAGEIMTPPVRVEARDAFGNRVLTFAGAISLTIGTNPGGATLGGTASAVATAGIATFSDLNLDVAATGYALAASSSGLTGATSATFDVSPGSASRLVFTVQPSDAVAGVVLAPAVRVEARDASGNLVPTFTGDVVVALSTNPGTATLSGTRTVTAVGGVATFSTLSLDKQGSGYRLSATTTGFGSAISTPFAITPAAASRLAVAQQPTDGVAATPISPAVQIAAEDAFGNRVSSFTGAVTIALGANPGTATLSGTLTVNAASGIASFTTLQLDRTGVGYTLVASATGLTSIETDAFDITAGTASSLAFVVQPATATAGLPMAPFTVHVRDALGNTDASFTGNVTVMISNNPGAASLAGTVSVLVTAGVATFDDLSLDKVGTGYTLSAATTGVPSATSMPFDVVAGAAVTYRATGLAANVAAGVPSAVVLTALDAHGNVAAGYTGTAALTSTDDAVEVPASVVFTAGVGASAEVVFHTLGVHDLTATDTTNASVTATFDTNVTMGAAPTVAVISPSSGDAVGGMVTIRAEGTVVATSAIVSLEILVDGAVVGTSETSPAEATWDAMSMPIGSSHTITARITDDAGNVVVSAPVVVTISEAPDGCGCRSGRGSSGPGPATAIAAGLVLLAVLRRRRRSTVTSR